MTEYLKMKGAEMSFKGTVRNLLKQKISVASELWSLDY